MEAAALVQKNTRYVRQLLGCGCRDIRVQHVLSYTVSWRPQETFLKEPNSKVCVSVCVCLCFWVCVEGIF